MAFGIAGSDYFGLELLEDLVLASMADFLGIDLLMMQLIVL